MLTHRYGITQPPSNDYYCLYEIYGRYSRTFLIIKTFQHIIKMFTPYAAQFCFAFCPKNSDVARTVNLRFFPENFADKQRSYSRD